MLFKCILHWVKPQGNKDALWLYFQCEICGEKIKVRVNKKTDIQQEYGSERPGAHLYTLRKEIMGSECFNLMTAELHFDVRYNVLSSDVKNGRLIDEAEYGRSIHV